MWDKVLLALPIALVLHFAMPPALRAISPGLEDAPGIAAPRSERGETCVPRFSASQDLCRPGAESEARDLSARRTSTRRSSLTSAHSVRVQPAPRRTSWRARPTSPHRLAHSDGEPPA
jgi:hypothetical protein